MASTLITMGLSILVWTMVFVFAFYYFVTTPHNHIGLRLVALIAGIGATFCMIYAALIIIRPEALEASHVIPIFSALFFVYMSEMLCHDTCETWTKKREMLSRSVVVLSSIVALIISCQCALIPAAMMLIWGAMQKKYYCYAGAMTLMIIMYVADHFGIPLWINESLYFAHVVLFCIQTYILYRHHLTTGELKKGGKKNV